MRLTRSERKAKKTRKQQRRLEAAAQSVQEFCFEAAQPTFKFAQGESDELPTFSAFAYGGGAIRPRGFAQQIVIDLASVTIAGNGQVPVLRNHDHGIIVGHTSLTNDGSALQAAGTISGVGPDATEIVELARNSYPHQVSIGGRSGRLEKLAAGKTTVVNGQQFTGPLLIARGAEIRELSFVAVGADAGTAVTIAAQADDEFSEEIDMKFQEWLEATFGLKADELSENQKSIFQAKYDEHVEAERKKKEAEALKAAAAEQDDITKKIRAQGSAEAARVAGINKAAAKHPEIIQMGIDNGWSVEKVEVLAAKADLEDLRNGRPLLTASGAPQEEFNDEQAGIIECAISRSYGLNDENALKEYGEKAMEATDKGDMKRYTLHRFMHQTIHAAGMHHPPGSYDDNFIKTAFHADRKLEASGFSTLSLPGILSNVANKIMLQSYRMHESIVPFCFGIRSTGDFKPFYSYRLEGQGTLEEIGPDGQIAHGGLSEQEYFLQLSTHAKMLALTRQMIINDDLSAFTQIAMKLGEMAFKAHEHAAVTLLVNPPQVGGNDFFSVAHGNLGTKELSIEGLTELDTLFGTQKDTEGYPISIGAQKLLVATSNRVLASQLMRETRIEVSGGTNQVRVLANNPFAGLYDWRMSPWLQSAMVANTDAANYWLFADPMTNAALCAGYLNGRQQPTIQSAETDFNTLGIQYRCFWDFTFGIEDYRFAAKSTGADAAVP